MANCKFCNGEVIERWWEQRIDSEGSLVGGFNYCECNRCGMRYIPEEVGLTNQWLPLSEPVEMSVHANFRRFEVTLPDGSQCHISCKDVDEVVRFFTAPPGMMGLTKDDIHIMELFDKIEEVEVPNDF